MSTTEQAQRNGDYVRGLLQNKQPEFAAVLERIVWELTCMSDAA